MHQLRAILGRYPALALLLIAAALCVKAVVPAGFMIGQQNTKTLTILVCHDGTGKTTSEKLVIPMKDNGDGAEKAKGECAFGSLGTASLAGADIALLAIVLAFILALGFAPIGVSLPQLPSHLRPPLRGPPVLA